MPTRKNVFIGLCPCGRTLVTVPVRGVAPAPGSSGNSAGFSCAVCTPHWILRQGTFTRAGDALRMRGYHDQEVRLGKRRLQIFRDAVDAWLILIGATTLDQEYDALVEARVWSMSASTFRSKRRRVERASDLALDYAAESISSIAAVCGKRELVRQIDAELAQLARDRRLAQRDVVTVRLQRHESPPA